MADIKSKVTISNDLIELFQGGGLRKAAARQIASVLREEFDEMLKSAPQLSGNYVANMRLGTSGIARGSAELYFKPNPSLEDAYRKGSFPAISIAMVRTEDFVEKATAHITGKGGWLRELVVYNPLKYADVTEGRDQLRKENEGAEHALAKMRDRLSRRFIPLNLKGLPG